MLLGLSERLLHENQYSAIRGRCKRGNLLQNNSMDLDRLKRIPLGSMTNLMGFSGGLKPRHSQLLTTGFSSDHDDRQMMSSWVRFGFLATVAFGTLYRMQFAGLEIGQSLLDLRQGHSHLGFYALLMPLGWFVSRPSSDLRSIASRLWWVYPLGVFVASLGFFWSGYNAFSHVGSAIVLLFWLSVAWNQRRFVAGIGIFLSVPFLLMVIITRVLAPEQVTLAVRSYLAVLLFHVAVPIALVRLRALVSKNGSDWPNGDSGPWFWIGPGRWFWSLITLILALHLRVPAGVDWGWLTKIGPGLMGILLIGITFHQGSQRTIFSWEDRRKKPAFFWLVLRTQWLLTGLGLIFWASGVTDFSSQREFLLAGLHILILGPLFSSLWPWQGAFSFWFHLMGVFFLGVGTLLTAFSSQLTWTGAYLAGQKGAILGGLLIFIAGLVDWIASSRYSGVGRYENESRKRC